jgi:hypothetical protein
MGATIAERAAEARHEFVQLLFDDLSTSVRQNTYRSLSTPISEKTTVGDLDGGRIPPVMSWACAETWLATIASC